MLTLEKSTGAGVQSNTSMGDVMNSAIDRIVAQYRDSAFFTYEHLTDEQLLKAESELNVTLPSQFVSFLRVFGHGGVAGVEILGVARGGVLSFVDETKWFRKYGLPNNLVAIENHDEWLACIDCDTGKVVTWSQGGEVLPECDSFDEYVLQEYREGIDNL